MKCNYCWKEAEWVENKEVYWKNYWKSYMIWLCRDCEAYVWCKKNTKKPLWILANKKLRKLRIISKKLFIHKFMGWNWKCKHTKKTEAYHKLSELLDIPVSKTHFWMFDDEKCRSVIKILKN